MNGPKHFGTTMWWPQNALPPCPVGINAYGERGLLLANEEDIDGTKVEIVEEGQRGEAFVGGMLAGIELPRQRSAWSARGGRLDVTQ